MNNNLGVVELLLLIPLVLLFVGVVPYVTWRRGGSKSRVVVALLVSLIPYGFIVGLIIALTTKRTGAPTPNAMTPESAGASVGALAASVNRQSGPDRSSLIAVILAVVLGSIFTGAIGYYVGRQDVRVPLPTWTDREIRATGTQNVGTLRCTYHLADGTVRVRESVIAISTNPPYDPFGTPNPLGARTVECPPSP